MATKITKVYLISLLIVLIFTLMDINNIEPFNQLNSNNAWDLYNKFSAPAIFFSWLGAFAVLGLLWFIAKKDKSEALAVFLTPTIMVYFGLEDTLFHVIKRVPMMQCMEWLNNNPILLNIARLIGENCITPLVLALSTLVGLIISYFVLIRFLIYSHHYYNYRDKSHLNSF